MSDWLEDSELFLYVNGTGPDDVHLWRCKKPASSSSSSSSLAVPMKPDDFDYVCNVKNHLELIGELFDWEENDYKRLVKYIYEKHLLVNSQGFVIAELLHEADKDGNKTIDDANEEDVPAIYIRSLDVLPLKPYIPQLNEQPIPLRTIKYLGDINGKAAMMVEDSNITKLTARVVDVESKNKTMDTNITMLTVGLATTTGNVVDLQSRNKTLEVENKTLEGKVTKLTADLVTQMTALTTLQQEVKNVNANSREVWMNDITNREWVGLEGLEGPRQADDIIIVDKYGTFTVDDNSTNVRARYWYGMKSNAQNTFTTHKVICLEDLVPNKERARFSQHTWWPIKAKGKTYVIRYAY